MMVPGAIPDVPSPTELWKNEKAQYRLWIIIFGIGLIALIALYLSALVWNIVEQESAKDLVLRKMISAFRTANATEPNPTQISGFVAAIDNSYKTYVLGLPGASLGLLAIGLGVYIYGIFYSYRVKTFERLPSYPMVIVTIVGVLAFIEFISMFWRGNTDSNFPGGIYLITARALALILSVFGAAPVNRIRRAFVYSRQIANIKASPEFQEMQRRAAAGQPFVPPTGGTPIFGPFGLPITQPGNASATPTPVAPLAAVNEVPPEVAELNSLELDELKAIAARLSLSGHQDMTREQLIENILRVTPRQDPAAKKAKSVTRSEQLAQMSLTELRRVAKSLSISGYLKMTKTELIETILRVSGE